MPHDDAERFRLALEAFNRGDLDGMVADMSPDVDFHVPGTLPDAQVYRGPEGVKRWAAVMNDAFEDLQMHFGEFEEVAPETVLVQVRATGRGRESGVEVEAPFWMLGSGTDGKLERMEFFPTAEEARAAVAASGR